MTRSTDTTFSCTSESLTSSISTPDTVVSKIPRRKTGSRIPISPARAIAVNNNNKEDKKIPKSKIPHKSKPKLKVITSVIEIAMRLFE